jgi:hypothetical protein
VLLLQAGPNASWEAQAAAQDLQQQQATTGLANQQRVLMGHPTQQLTALLTILLPLPLQHL